MPAARQPCRAPLTLELHQEEGSPSPTCLTGQVVFPKGDAASIGNETFAANEPPLGQTNGRFFYGQGNPSRLVQTRTKIPQPTSIIMGKNVRKPDHPAPSVDRPFGWYLEEIAAWIKAQEEAAGPSHNAPCESCNRSRGDKGRLVCRGPNPA